MKHINKNKEPTEFADWKNCANDDWTPTFLNLQNPEKQSVFNSLLNEQGYICCYCERELKENDFHIEHFKPKDSTKFPELQLEYSNFLCSCQRNTTKSEPLHCGNSKENWFEESLIVSPLLANCEGEFTFYFDGHISPSNEQNEKAKETIKRLQLDNNKLVAMRNKLLEPFLEDLTDLELNNFVNGYLVEKENNNGKYNEFYTTIKDLFLI